MHTWYLILLCVLILLSAFFSAAETALTSLHMVRVKSMLLQKKPGSKILYKLKRNAHKFIITILIGNNIVNILATAIATFLFVGYFGASGVAISAVVMTIVILVFGEIFPKLLAVQHNEAIARFVALPIYWLSIILYPFVWLFTQLSKFITLVFGTTKKKVLSEDDLRVILSIGKEEGIISRKTAKLMHKVLDFEDIKVTKIMTPSEKMVCVNGEQKLNDAIDFIVKNSFSKYPVYVEDKDNIIGVIDVDDVLKAIKEKRANTLVKELIRPLKFVQEDKEIGDLLYEFEDNPVLMAIVLGKNGDVLGLVTIEDILEEIVGNIFDKSNKKRHPKS